MTTIHTCIAKKVYILSHDAETPKIFAEAVDALAISEGAFGLDSVDAGDAMGYMMEYYESYKPDTDDLMVVTPDRITITIGADWELFHWNPLEMPKTLGQIISDIGVNEITRRIQEEFGDEG